MPTEQARKCAEEIDDKVGLAFTLGHGLAEIIDRYFPTKHNAEKVAELREALEPFATFAENNVDADGWNDVGISTSHDRIVDWFGPSDFRQARAALNEQIRQQNEINRATGQGHDAAKRETAGMVGKLRKALEKQGFHKLNDGSLCFCEHRNPASLHEEHGEHCQLARTALAGSETPAKDAWAEGNAMLKKIGEPTADRNAGLVEKLREALGRYGSHKSGCDFYQGGDCQEDCDCGWSQARAALVETEWVSAQHGQDQYRQIPGEALAESEPQQQPVTKESTDCPIPPTTPEEANDILASVGLPPQQQPVTRVLWSDAPDVGPPAGSMQTDADTPKPTVTIPLQLSPAEIARRIVAPWTVYGNVRIDGKVIERAIIAVIEKERKIAAEAKLSVVRYAGKRIAELERQLQLEWAKPDRDKQWREEALAIIAEQKRQLSPSPCAKERHRQADLVPERRKGTERIKQNENGAFYAAREGETFWQPERRKSNSGPPCGRCESEHAHYLSGYIAGARSVNLAKARSEALEEAKERLDALCKEAGGHPSLEEIYTAIRGKK